MLQADQQVPKQLEAAHTLCSEFLAILSHELKNPLNLILMNAELLGRSVPALSQLPASRAVDTIRRTVHAQSQIINDLLDPSRISTGELSLARTPVPWQSEATRLIEAMRPPAREKQVELVLDADDVVVLADAVRLEQIVWSLVSNALKFTSPGDRVSVHVTREGAYARLTVTDYGCG